MKPLAEIYGMLHIMTSGHSTFPCIASRSSGTSHIDPRHGVLERLPPALDDTDLTSQSIFLVPLGR